MEYTIRKMKKKDIDGIRHVARESWHDTYEGVIPLDIQDNFLNMAYDKKQLLQRMKKSKLYIAENAGKVLGFANYNKKRSKPVAELEALYVLPEFQGIGIGTGLLKLAFQELHAEEIQLNVEKGNKKGLHFYDAKGFKKLKEFEEDFDGHLLQTIRMSLKKPIV